MTDQVGKPTKGPFEIRKGGGYRHFDDDDYAIVSKELVTPCLIFGGWGVQGEANVKLVAEAFNVHHETNLTPRQLAEQRAELLAAIEQIASLCPMIEPEWTPEMNTYLGQHNPQVERCLWSIGQELRTAINNARTTTKGDAR